MPAHSPSTEVGGDAVWTCPLDLHMRARSSSGYKLAQASEQVVRWMSSRLEITT